MREIVEDVPKLSVEQRLEKIEKRFVQLDERDARINQVEREIVGLCHDIAMAELHGLVSCRENGSEYALTTRYDAEREAKSMKERLNGKILALGRARR